MERKVTARRTVQGVVVSDKNDKTITEQFIYLRDNCPYGWGTPVKSGAKYMVIEKPEIVI